MGCGKLHVASHARGPALARRPAAPDVVVGLLLLLPAVAVGWLGFRLIEQTANWRCDRARSGVIRPPTGSSPILDKALSATERRLSASRPDAGIQPGDDAVLVTIRAGRLEALPAEHLLYSPDPPVAAQQSTPAFAAAESLELRGDHSRAVEAYRALAASPDEATRTGALVRLARTLRKMRRPEEALPVYDDLAKLTRTAIAGLPADSVARRARTALLAELGRKDDVVTSARLLEQDLTARRWILDQGTFVAYTGQVRDWLGKQSREMADGIAVSNAVDWLWHERRRGALAPAGRMALRPRTDGADVTVLWQSPIDRVVALVAGPRFGAREWIDPLARWRRARSAVRGCADSTRTPAGPRGATGRRLRAGPPRKRASRGRWSSRPHPGTGDDGSASRRHSFLRASALLLAVVASGGYVVARGVTRELAVARLQSDFVSAVSHEFRTPLTSLQQFTAILNEDDEPAPASDGRSIRRRRVRPQGCSGWWSHCWTSAAWRPAPHDIDTSARCWRLRRGARRDVPPRRCARGVHRHVRGRRSTAARSMPIPTRSVARFTTCSRTP